MTRPSFSQAALTALAISLAGAVLSYLLPIAGLGLAITNELSSAVIAIGVPGIWLLYLMSTAESRPGRIAFMAGWLLITSVSVVMTVSVFELMTVQLAMLWLMRTIWFHRSILSSLADMALTGLSALVALATALHTGSLFLSLWTLLLVQALFVWIPPALPTRTTDTPTDVDDPFETACRNAQNALRSMANAQNNF